MKNFEMFFAFLVRLTLCKTPKSKRRKWVEIFFSFRCKKQRFEKERENLWANTRLSLAVSLEKPNKIYGKIQVEPSTILDLVDHFEFFVNDVEQSVRLASDELHFSAQGFAGGEQYEVYVVACPKSNLVDSSPILSNKRVKISEKNFR